MLPTPVAPLLGCELFDSSNSGLPPLSSSTNIYSSFLPQVHSFNESVTHISLTANSYKLYYLLLNLQVLTVA